MTRTKISKDEFKNYFSIDKVYNSNKSLIFKNKIFDFEVQINSIEHDIIFKNCLFEKDVYFSPSLDFMKDEDKIESDPNDDYLIEDKVFKRKITFENLCEFDQNLSFENLVFLSKVRIHNCILNYVNFNNTVFKDLVDFWSTNFKKTVIFYKTDFNSTTVFSFATFHENVLFTYSLFAGKTIFAKTIFKKGIDISQAVIKDKIQLFDLRFDFENYDTEYIGENHSYYQDSIDSKAIIPLENKVHTFQILKKAFEDIGNYSDSIVMQREEKRALRKLAQERLNDKNVGNINFGDTIILWLNRWSNHYQSDFRNGVWFTLAMVVIFGTPTLISTSAYLDHVCLSNCRFSADRFNNGIKFFFNFLNPARSISYLDELKPFGIAYLFDFLGRIAVGYGFYQTIQAFRKFK